MNVAERKFLVREVGETISDLLQDREGAISLEQYQSHSKWIQDELDRLAPHDECWFEANRLEKAAARKTRRVA